MADIDEHGKVTAEVDCYVVFTGDGQFAVSIEAIALCRDEALRRLNQVTLQALEDLGDDVIDVISRTGNIIGKLFFIDYTASRFMVRLEVDRLYDAESEGVNGLFSLMGTGLQSAHSALVEPDFSASSRVEV